MSWGILRASFCCVIFVKNQYFYNFERLGSSWGVCGRLGGRPGCVLVSWVVLRGVLGAFWGILGASWGRLGASWWRLGSDSQENIDFLSIFASNFKPRNLKNQAPAAGRARFSKNRFWKLTPTFNPILLPTWLHFGT